VNVHEYQAKALLREFGVAVPDGQLATTPAEAEEVARALGGKTVVVKAQIHAGGRGKGGGIKLAKSTGEAKQVASEILGMTLRTPQTGPEGKVVHKVYVEVGSAIARELYLAITLDRAAEKLAIIASTEGGMAIEEVAEATPEKIVTVHVDPTLGLQDYHVRRVGFGLGLAPEPMKQLGAFLRGLYRLFVEKDCSLVEINPLVVTESGELVALDGKLNFDDNALYRHPDVVALRDETEEDAKEIEASKYDLNYVALDGSIGCMVNGAGLAMATMDIIKLYGETPANFLDVGGGATKEKVAAAFKIITSDPNVKGILINIFGGIMRCDVIAEGVVAAVKEVGLKVPLVVRLEGTNVDLGKKIIAESGLNVVSADDLDDAAQKIVKSVRAA
jgi:succinyl-CoA synthetase beta subunit